MYDKLYNYRLSKYEKNMLKNENDPKWNYIMQDGTKCRDYFLIPSELRARLASLRYDNRLSPTHQYTKEELEAMKQDPNFRWNDLDNIADDYLLHMINNYR